MDKSKAGFFRGSFVREDFKASFEVPSEIGSK